MTTSKKSLQFLPTMCVIPLSLHAGEEKQIATEQFTLAMSQSGLGPTMAYTYTKPKGLLVMRKSFFP